MIWSVVQRTLSDDDAIVLRAVDHLMTEGAGPYPVAIEVSRWRNLAPWIARIAGRVNKMRVLDDLCYCVEARAARRTEADVMPSFEASYFQRRLSPR